MNTTEIITKLRAQAAELNAMADALEEATENAAFATGAGRYLIHGAVKVGDWNKSLSEQLSSMSTALATAQREHETLKSEHVAMVRGSLARGTRGLARR